MAELIDKGELMEKLNVFNDRVHGNEHFLYGIETAKELLEDTQTAYDVEKVVEQIHDYFCKVIDACEEDIDNETCVKCLKCMSNCPKEAIDFKFLN